MTQVAMRGRTGKSPWMPDRLRASVCRHCSEGRPERVFVHVGQFTGCIVGININLAVVDVRFASCRGEDRPTAHLGKRDLQFPTDHDHVFFPLAVHGEAAVAEGGDHAGVVLGDLAHDALAPQPLATSMQ